MTETGDTTTEEEFEPGDGHMETDLDAIETAAEALDEEGLDATAEDLEGAIQVLDGLDDTASAEGYESEEDEEAHMQLLDIRNDVQAVADGEEPVEYDTDELAQALAELGMLFIQAALEDALAAGMGGPGGEMPDGL